MSAVEHAKIIFAALAPLAIGEIVDMATSLVEPITMGTCRSLMLNLGVEKERFSKAIEDLFALPPPNLLHTLAHLTPRPPPHQRHLLQLLHLLQQYLLILMQKVMVKRKVTLEMTVICHCQSMTILTAIMTRTSGK